MEELNVQITELAFPFPAKIFERELAKNQIQFREIEKTNSEGAFSSKIYFVSPEDVDKARLFRDKIEKENVISEEQHRHPILKILAYISLFLIVFYLIFEVFQIFSKEY